MRLQITLYLNDISVDFCLKSKLFNHSIFLPYLYSFYFFFLVDALKNVLDGFGFSCSYEHPFFPYFEYCFFFFIFLVYARLFISSLLIQNKNYYFFLAVYLFIFVLFLCWCDWYSHYHLVWNEIDQKYTYILNFNISGAAFIFLFCLLSFFIFDIFLIAIYIYPKVSIGFFSILVFIFICFDISYLEILKIVHNLLEEVSNSIRNCMSTECMQSNPDLSAEKTPRHVVASEAKSEAFPKTLTQQAAEYIGDYRYEQRPVECKDDEITVRYTRTPEGCRVSFIQCLTDPRLPSSVDSALNNNLPSGYAAGPFSQHVIGEPIRTATEVGIASSVELKETRCQEVSSILFKSIENYKKK